MYIYIIYVVLTMDGFCHDGSVHLMSTVSFSSSSFFTKGPSSSFSS